MDCWILGWICMELAFQGKIPHQPNLLSRFPRLILQWSWLGRVLIFLEEYHLSSNPSQRSALSYKFLARPDLPCTWLSVRFHRFSWASCPLVRNGFSLFWCVFGLRLWRYSDTRGSGFGVEIRFSESFELLGVWFGTGRNLFLYSWLFGLAKYSGTWNQNS